MFPIPAAPPRDRIRRTLPLALLPLVLGGVGGDVLAQDAAAAPDPTLVVTRTVHPRIAYYALEPQQNPVALQAVLFPTQRFNRVIDGITAELVGDDALGQRGSAGLAPGRALGPGLQDRLGGLATAADPAPAGGGAGGSAQSGPRGFGGLGSVLSGAVLRASNRATGR